MPPRNSGEAWGFSHGLRSGLSRLGPPREKGPILRGSRLGLSGSRQGFCTYSTHLCTISSGRYNRLGLIVGFHKHYTPPMPSCSPLRHALAILHHTGREGFWGLPQSCLLSPPFPVSQAVAARATTLPQVLPAARPKFTDTSRQHQRDTQQGHKGDQNQQKKPTPPNHLKKRSENVLFRWACTLFAMRITFG